MIFGSVCSGIEAASVAWHHLGWQAAWLAEIEPFPSAVLKHHYPEVPNYGDMTKLPERILSGDIEAPDLFCGGTPCQAFSVAGLRKSLDDARGNLSLTFCEIANAIDDVRRARGDDECIVLWENVPGVLSTQDNAFGCFLSALAGCDTAIDPLAATGWTNAGVVAGPQRTVAWRVLDAQYFGLAQRRRRVFVVASAREGFDPVEVLLEFDGVRRDTAPSREAGKVAPTIPSRSTAGGGLGTDFDLDGRVIQAFGGNRTSGPIDVAPALNACGTASGRQDFETEAFITTAHTLRGEGFDASEDGTGRGTPLVPVHAFDARQSNVIQYGDKTGPLDTDGHSVGVAIPIDTMNHLGRGDSHSFGDFQPGAPSYTLTKGHSHAVAVAMRESGQGYWVEDSVSDTLRTDSNRAGKDGTVIGQPVRYGDHQQDTLHHESGIMSTLPGGSNDNAGHYTNTVTAMQVRRLTPRECERLQGFPDDYTAIPWRNKPASECPDGPRYKALGNSWAVPVVRWIGVRIAAQLSA